jgi:hypothetical protein
VKFPLFHPLVLCKAVGGIKTTFSVDKQNNILAECLVRVTMYRQDFDDFVGQGIRGRLLIVRVMRGDHELLIQNQLSPKLADISLIAKRGPYQYANNWVMVWIIGII